MQRRRAVVLPAQFREGEGDDRGGDEGLREESQVRTTRVLVARSSTHSLLGVAGVRRRKSLFVERRRGSRSRWPNGPVPRGRRRPKRHPWSAPIPAHRLAYRRLLTLWLPRRSECRFRRKGRGALSVPRGKGKGKRPARARADSGCLCSQCTGADPARQ